MHVGHEKTKYLLSALIPVGVIIFSRQWVVGLARYPALLVHPAWARISTAYWDNQYASLKVGDG